MITLPNVQGKKRTRKKNDLGEVEGCTRKKKDKEKEMRLGKLKDERCSCPLIEPSFYILLSHNKRNHWLRMKKSATQNSMTNITLNQKPCQKQF